MGRDATTQHRDSLARALNVVQTMILVATAAGLFVMIGRRDQTLTDVVTNTGKLTALVAELTLKAREHDKDIEQLRREMDRLSRTLTREPAAR